MVWDVQVTATLTPSMFIGGRHSLRHKGTFSSLPDCLSGTKVSVLGLYFVWEDIPLTKQFILNFRFLVDTACRGQVLGSCPWGSPASDGSLDIAPGSARSIWTAVDFLF